MTDFSPAVSALVEKHKQEVAARASKKSASSTSKEDTKLVLTDKLPVLKNKISYRDIAGEDHPDGTERWYPKCDYKWKHKEDIPTPDPLWVPDHATLPHTITAVAYGHNALIVGPPGTGKTKDVREVCARLGIPYYRFSGMGGLEPADLLGGNQLLNGKTQWVDGAIMRAVRHGGVWAYDEPFKSPAETNMAVQWLAESTKSDRSVMLYGHEDPKQIKVTAHEKFQMILCDNARGTGDNMDLYAATSIQDVSFLNRMEIHISKNYMDAESEQRALAAMFPWITQALAKKMVSFAGIMRVGWEQGSLELPFSFRELEAWAKLIAAYGGDIRLALDGAYGNALQPEEQEIYRKGYLDVGFTRG